MKTLQNFWRNPFTIRTTGSGINYACNHEPYLSPALSEAELGGLITQYMVLEYKAGQNHSPSFYQNITKHIKELYRYDTTFLNAVSPSDSLESLAAVILVYPGELLIRYDFDAWRITAA